MSDPFNQDKSFINSKFKLENEKKHYGIDFFSSHLLDRQIKVLQKQNEDSVNFLQVYDCYENSPNQSVIITKNCASRNISSIKTKEFTSRFSKIEDIKKQINAKQSQFTQCNFSENNSLLKTGLPETGTVNLTIDLPNISSFNTNLRKSSRPYRKSSEESRYSNSVIFENNLGMIKDKQFCFNDLPFVLKTSQLQNSPNLYTIKSKIEKPKNFDKLYDKIFGNKKLFKDEKPKNVSKSVNNDSQYFKYNSNTYNIKEQLEEIQAKVTFINRLL
jgi:hypothetical protein